MAIKNYDYTIQIKIDTIGTMYEKLDNHNELKARVCKDLSCMSCRHFSSTCSLYVGKYHKPCYKFFKLQSINK